MNRNEVKALVDAEEPDYATVEYLEPDAARYLREVVESDDPMAAAKATYIASVAGDVESIAILEVASSSPHPEVRVAAVDAAMNLIRTSGSAGTFIEALPRQAFPNEQPKAAERILEALAQDEDKGVRSAAKSAVRWRTR